MGLGNLVNERRKLSFSIPKDQVHFHASQGTTMGRFHSLVCYPLGRFDMRDWFHFIHSVHTT